MAHFKTDEEALRAVRDWLMAFPPLPTASPDYVTMRVEMREAIERAISVHRIFDQLSVPPDKVIR